MSELHKQPAQEDPAVWYNDRYGILRRVRGVMVEACRVCRRNPARSYMLVCHHCYQKARGQKSRVR